MISLNRRPSVLYEHAFDGNIRDEFASALVSARSRPIRTYRQFAEQEIRIAKGRHKGERFRVHRQPMQGPILDSFESARVGGFKRYAGAFNIQGGKTLLFVGIPCVYHIAEMAETVVLAAPNMEMCRDKWRTEIEPVFAASPNLSWLLPRRGRGSQGGFAESVRFENGAELKFMSAGGGDEKRSGYTTRITLLTEVDKMDKAGEASRETNPIAQIENRAASYGGDNLIIMECTVSNPEGRIWQEFLGGTQHQFHVRCPHCGVWGVPERTWLFGFAEAKTVKEAERSAYFACPACNQRINSEQRVAMVHGAVMAAQGQSVEGDGLVVGDVPDVETFSVRANAFHNLFWSVPFIANHAWRTHRAIEQYSPQAEDLQREQDQFHWTTPHAPVETGAIKLDPDRIQGRVSDLPYGIVPSEAIKTTIGIDIGSYTGWWLALCGLPDGRLYIPAYGAFSSPTMEQSTTEIAMYAALMDTFDKVVKKGLIRQGTGEAVPFDKVWIDGGFMTNVVARVVRANDPKRGPHGRVRMSAGRGASMMTKMRYSSPRRKDLTIRMIGDRWHGEWHQTQKVMQAFFDADIYKLRIHRALTILPISEPGSISYHRPTGHEPHRSEHARLSRHFTNEQYKPVETKTGPTKKWIRRGDNHWLDCAAQALAALNEAGWSGIPAPKLEDDTKGEAENGEEENQDPAE